MAEVLFDFDIKTYCWKCNSAMAMVTVVGDTAFSTP